MRKIRSSMKKRAICLIAIGLIFGIIGGQYLPKYGPSFFGYFCVILFVNQWIQKKEEKQFLTRLKKIFFREKTWIFLVVISVLFGAIDCQYEEKKKYHWDLDQQEVSFSGTILQREQKEELEYYLVLLDSLNGKKLNPKIKIKLVTRKNKDTMISYGSFVTGRGIWQEFQTQRNEFGFHEKNYQKAKGISAKIQAERKQIQERKNEKRWDWKSSIRELREAFGKILEKHLGEEESALAKALLLGKTEDLSAQAKEIYQDSSLAHLIAISGSHVSILFGVLQRLGKKCAKRLKQIGLLFFFVFFSILAGESASVQRACICTGLSLLASLLSRKSDSYQNLAISLLFLLWQNPFCIFDIGLQLSYLGTLAILTCQKKKQSIKQCYLKRKWESLKEEFFLTWKVNFVIFPILMVSFHKVSLAFAFSGILLNPLLNVILLLGYFLLGIGNGIEKIANPLWKILHLLLRYFSKSSRRNFTNSRNGSILD